MQRLHLKLSPLLVLAAVTLRDGHRFAPLRAGIALALLFVATNRSTFKP